MQSVKINIITLLKEQNKEIYESILIKRSTRNSL